MIVTNEAIRKIMKQQFLKKFVRYSVALRNHLALTPFVLFTTEENTVVIPNSEYLTIRLVPFSIGATLIETFIYPRHVVFRFCAFPILNRAGSKNCVSLLSLDTGAVLLASIFFNVSVSKIRSIPNKPVALFSFIVFHTLFIEKLYYSLCAVQLRLIAILYYRSLLLFLLLPKTGSLTNL